MLAGLDASLLMAPRWSFFHRSASPDSKQAAVAHSRPLSTSCREASRPVRRRVLESTDLTSPRKTRQHTTWLDKLYIAARSKMGLWQTEKKECFQERRDAFTTETEHSDEYTTAHLTGASAIVEKCDSNRSFAPSISTNCQRFGNSYLLRSTTGICKHCDDDARSDGSSHSSLSGMDDEVDVASLTVSRKRSLRPDLKSVRRTSRRRVASDISCQCNLISKSSELDVLPGRDRMLNDASLGFSIMTCEHSLNGHIRNVDSVSEPSEVKTSESLPESIDRLAILTPQYASVPNYPPAASLMTSRHGVRFNKIDDENPDEFYNRMHRPLENIEKRAKRREIELMRYAEHMGKLREEAPELFGGRAGH